jgi:energy-coupling factor transporter ATP-binding protein EcfA2
MKSVISGREIPKDLQGVQGMRSGFEIPNIQECRLVITGQPGSGKSTFLNSNPWLLSLDPERGGDTAADPQALRFTPPPNTPADVLDMAYLEFVDKIIARKLKGSNDIRMIALDTIDEFVDIFLTALCLRKKVDDPIDLKDGSGNGYTIVRKSLFGMLDKIHRAGIGWALIAHTATKTIRVGNEEKQISGLAVSNSFKGAIFQKCEHMLFIEHGVDQVKGVGVVNIVKGKPYEKPGKTVLTKVRKMKTRPGGLWQGGDTQDVKVRIPLQSEVILPPLKGWDTFVTAYDNAVKELTATADPELEPGPTPPPVAAPSQPRGSFKKPILRQPSGIKRV